MSGDPTPHSVLEDVVVTAPLDGVAVVELHGDHDRLTADELETLLRELTLENPLVVVDVTDARFIDSSFLHSLVNADRHAREADNRFVLQLGTGPAVRKTLEVSGLLEVLTCVSTREDALTPASPRSSTGRL